MSPMNVMGRDIFNRAVPNFGSAIASAAPSMAQPMPQFNAVAQSYTPQTGGPTPRTPAPNPMPQFQAVMQNFTPQVAGPTPQQPPPFVPPTPMPFINRPMPQFQQPNFSFLGGQIAPPNPAMNMTMPSMKGLFGVR